MYKDNPSATWMRDNITQTIKKIKLQKYGTVLKYLILWLVNMVTITRGVISYHRGVWVTDVDDHHRWKIQSFKHQMISNVDNVKYLLANVFTSAGENAVLLDTCHHLTRCYCTSMFRVVISTMKVTAGEKKHHRSTQCSLIYTATLLLTAFPSTVPYTSSTWMWRTQPCLCQVRGVQSLLVAWHLWWCGHDRTTGRSEAIHFTDE